MTIDLYHSVVALPFHSVLDGGENTLSSVMMASLNGPLESRRLN